jgi:hypothetical protein
MRGQYHAFAYWDIAEKLLFEQDLEPDVLTILDCPFAGRGHHTPYRGVETRSSGNTHDTRRIYELIAACGGDATTPTPGQNSFTARFVTALQGVLDDQVDGVLTTRLIAEVNKDCREVAYLFDRLKENDNRHIQLKVLRKQTKQYVRQLAANLGEQPPEQAAVNLRLSLYTHQLSKKMIEQLADALVGACEGIVPLRRISWVNMEQFDPSEHLHRLVEVVHSLRDNPRRRLRRAIETVIDRNRSARIRDEAAGKIKAQQRIRKAIQHVIDRNRLVARESFALRRHHNQEADEGVDKERPPKESLVPSFNRPGTASHKSKKRARSSDVSNTAQKLAAPARRLRSSARAEQSSITRSTDPDGK